MSDFKRKSLTSFKVNYIHQTVTKTTNGIMSDDKSLFEFFIVSVYTVLEVYCVPTSIEVSASREINK